MALDANALAQLIKDTLVRDSSNPDVSEGSLSFNLDEVKKRLDPKAVNYAADLPGEIIGAIATAVAHSVAHAVVDHLKNAGSVVIPAGIPVKNGSDEIGQTTASDKRGSIE